MGEFIQPITGTNFCLTFDQDENRMHIKVWSGEDAGGSIADVRVSKPLDKVSTRSPEMNTLKKKIETNSSDLLKYVDKKQFKIGIDDAFGFMLDQYYEWLDKAEEREEEERQKLLAQRDQELEQLANEGYSFLEETENPLVWIAQEIDWITAGERLNILYAFIAFCSQVILKNPISVIAIGEGGSGKTHIVDTALALMPEEYIKNMKSSTMAAVYAKSDSDPYFFDGKIINMGDMGGQADHEEAQEFKNIMKEMQTEGYVSRTKMVKGENGEQIDKEFELFGKPCITYTNVPGHQFDDQEMSRSIMLTPRLDNDLSVHWFKQLNRQVNTPTKKNIEFHKNNLAKLNNMVHALRKRMDGVSIDNPYASFILRYLNESRYFKRDVDKFDGILRIITAINGFKRPLHKTEFGEVLFTTKDDIMIFIDLLSRYHESITKNLSPGASDLLRQLRDKADEWDLYEEGVTVNDFVFKSGTTLSKRSLQNYFGELNTMGLVKTDGKEGRQNVYVLIDTGSAALQNDISLTENDIKVLKYNYGINSLKMFEQRVGYVPGEILRDTNGPFWNDFLPNGDQRNS